MIDYSVMSCVNCLLIEEFRMDAFVFIETTDAGGWLVICYFAGIADVTASMRLHGAPRPQPPGFAA
jgi:hypothetical protein